jgi:pimeloyl-ACP methyl ester carboxylesterase
MNPFYFGSTARRIFGLYEPASSAGTQLRCAVLCHPWGHEYLCAHRAMRQLSTRLTSVGFHTLRFDYFGTGDSGGEAADTDLTGWECDASFAVDEIQEIVGQAKITLIGLRLGAVVAARLAAKRSDIIDALVLWDPVISSHERFARSGSRSKLNSIEFMSDVRPWLEDTSHAGHLPVGALQRIVDWLA